MVSFLEGLKPFGVPLKVTALETGNGFLAETSGPAYVAAKEAMETAWGGETAIVATGGSIPLVNALAEAVPGAEILLLGATDGYSNIHAPDERVILDELEKTIVAEAEFFRLFAEQRRGSSSPNTGATSARKRVGKPENAGPDQRQIPRHGAGGARYGNESDGNGSRWSNDS